MALRGAQYCICKVSHIHVVVIVVVIVGQAIIKL